MDLFKWTYNNLRFIVINIANIQMKSDKMLLANTPNTTSVPQTLEVNITSTV